ncbi:MAG: hypothetical protein NTY77_04620 [Elusimicrobia bacterium]|nr:hypothetical protein [Elusimicrobiota bacterium]
MISRCPSCGIQVDDEAQQCPKCYWDFAKFKRVPPPGAAPAKEEAPPPRAANDFTPEPELPASAFAPAPAPLPPPVQLPPIGNFGAQTQGPSLPAAPQPQAPAQARPDESGGLSLPQLGRIGEPAPRAQGPSGIPMLPAVPPSRTPGDPPFAPGRPIGASASPPPLLPVSDYQAPSKAAAAAPPPGPKAAPKPILPPAEKKAPGPSQGLPQVPRARPAKPEPPPLTAVQSGGGWGSASPPRPSAAKPGERSSTTVQPKPGRGRSPLLNRVTAGVVILGVFFVIVMQIVMRPDVKVGRSSSSMPTFAKDSRPQPLQLPPAKEAGEPAAAAPLPSVAPSSTSAAAAPVEPVRTTSAPAVAPAVPAAPAAAPKPPAPAAPAKAAPPAAKPRAHKRAPRPEPDEDEGPRWTFEGSVYDLISLRPVHAAILAFKDSSGKVFGQTTTDEYGDYRVSLEPLSEAAYVMSAKHADYQEKYIDEIKPPFKEVSLEERRQLVSMSARARPWVGKTGLTVRRDFVMIPKDLGKGGPEAPAVPGQ